MKISNYVFIIMAIIAASVVTLGLIAIVAIDRTNYFRTRADLAAAQVHELVDLARSGTHLSEHVAEHFMFKQHTLEEIEHGQTDLKKSLENLQSATEKEVGHLRSRDEVEAEQEDAVRIEKIETLLRTANQQIADMLLLEEQGKFAEAVQLLESKFNMQTLRGFETLVAEAIEEERAEANVARKTAEEFWIWLRRMAIATTGILLGAAIIVAFSLARKINRPIAELTLGANAIANGNFGHRITNVSKDELGDLARSFNKMAEALAAGKIAQSEAQSLMERKVEDRTADLRQKAIELDNANTRLSHLNRNRTQFLADISHEVRTPLTTLRGEAELALRLKVRSAEPYRLALAKVLSISETIGKLVDDLLFLARSESDSLRFDMRSVNLADVVRSVLEDASVLAKAREIIIRKMFDETSRVQVEGDPVRIKQALLIGVDNALKFSSPGKNVDFVMTTIGNTADFIIRDFGPGVSDEDLPFVFERFYRSKQEAGLPGGFGLGLSIAKWIVDKHGGTIRLHCQKNSQTELIISLPLIHVEGRSKG